MIARFQIARHAAPASVPAMSRGNASAGGINIVFIDGHVETPGSTISGSCIAQRYVRQRRDRAETSFGKIRSVSLTIGMAEELQIIPLLESFARIPNPKPNARSAGNLCSGVSVASLIIQRHEQTSSVLPRDFIKTSIARSRP